MSADSSSPQRRLPWLKLAVVAVVCGAAGLLLLRGVDVRGWVDRGMALIREAGPVAFFGAMTILPAFGVPMLAFTIPAGEAFGAQLGLPLVIVISLVAIAANMALGYAIARYLFRPVLARLLERYGYQVPRITPENALNILLLVRLTPGPPYAVQTYLLGAGEAPFRKYLVVSWVCILPWAIGAIVLGKGLFGGNFAAVLVGIGVLVAASVVLQWVRKKYARREN